MKYPRSGTELLCLHRNRLICLVSFFLVGFCFCLVVFFFRLFLLNVVSFCYVVLVMNVRVFFLLDDPLQRLYRITYCVNIVKRRLHTYINDSTRLHRSWSQAHCTCLRLGDGTFMNRRIIFPVPPHQSAHDHDRCNLVERIGRCANAYFNWFNRVLSPFTLLVQCNTRV